MDYYAQPESSLTRHRRRKTGITLVFLPFALTFWLILWHSAAVYWQKELDEFYPPFSLLELCMRALFSPYMLFTLPVMLGGLWLYTRPLNVASTLYNVITGIAYFIAALFGVYITFACML